MGEITTFYSFKGGAGRTMSLANTAVLLARQPNNSGKRILMMDWDLEAPGLEDYFKPYCSTLEEKEGIVEWVSKALKKLPAMPYRAATVEATQQLEDYFETLESLLIPVKVPQINASLYLVRAGKRDNDYAVRLRKLQWDKLYKRIPEFFPLLAKYLSKKFDTVLIDSRTGHSDIGGITTISLPENLVLVFTPNDQSQNGVLKIAKNAAEYRLKYGDGRPLGIFPLPSRIDFSGVAKSKRENWQNKYRLNWEKIFQEIYGLPPSISLKDYFEKVYIRHDSNYAFGEDLAVLNTDNFNTESIQDDYNRLIRYLSFDEIWENKPFERLSKPMRLMFVFSEKDEQAVSAFMSHLSPLRHQEAVIWNDVDLCPIENWDVEMSAKVARGDADIIVVFESTHLMNVDKERMKNVLDSHVKTKTYRLALHPMKKTSPLQEIEPLLPHKTLADWQNPDEAWLEVSKQFRRQLIKTINQPSVA